MASIEECVAGILSRAPEPTAEQLAKVAAILLPVEVGTSANLPDPVGVR